VKSGAPTTTDLNTLINAYIMYCAVRLTSPDLEPQIAFRMLGICYGDDSVFELKYRNRWCKAAKILGMTLKVETSTMVKGMTFCGRTFPKPAETISSMQDPLRTIRKLNITGRDISIPIGDAAMDRMEGYLATDAHTPLIGDYARAIVRCYRETASTYERRHTRKSVNIEKNFFYIHALETPGGSWPQEAVDYDMFLECISNRLEVPLETLITTIDLINTCTDPWAIPAINRDFDKTPYVGTLDGDALFTEGVVGSCKLAHERDVQERRINPNLPGTSSEPESRAPSSTGRPVGAGPTTGKGHGKSHKMPQQHHHKGAVQHIQLSGQAPRGKGPGLPKGPGRGRGRGGQN
jgi:hypothetical protein